MYKTKLTTEDKRNIYLEFNKDEYEIEYVRSKGAIILRRLSDNKVLEIFDDRLGFIVQNDRLQETNFLVTQCCPEEKKNYFKHFVTNKYSDELRLKRKFEWVFTQLEDCRITNNSFVVEQEYYGGVIYNLDKKSKKFKYIYKDEKINKILGDDVLMVSEDKLSIGIKDTITYGINPETYEIVTPIWSEMQHRYIDVYTKEKVEELQKELSKKHMYINKTASLGDITIHFEVEKYLELITQYLAREEQIYLDIMKSAINENFVKKFIKK